MKSFFKKLLFLLSITFMPVFLFSVKAATLSNNSYNLVINNNSLPYNTGTSAYSSISLPILFYNLSGSDVNSQKFNYLILDVCTGNAITSDNISIVNNGTTSYFDSNSLLFYNTNMSCDFGNGYKGNLYKIQMFVGKYVDSQGDGLYAASYLKIINSYHYYTITIFKSSVVSDEDVLTGLIQNNITNDLQRDILNQQKEFNKKQDETNKNLENIEEKQNQTNQKVDDLKDSITSTDAPELDALSNSAGWFPAGPLDSILNLPLSFLQNLFTNLSKTCQPVTLSLPYVNKNIQLPCLNTIYSQIDGLSTWINSIGVIASAFMLFSYLIKLYKWVDDTLTFRENNYIDNWGGI